MLISVLNNQSINVPKTYVAQNTTAGTNAVPWRNPNGFVASWAVQIGESGQGQSEVVLLGTATPSGTIGTFTANTLYDHPADTAIYGIKFDQIVFGRSTTGTSGVSSPLANGTVTIQANGTQTVFDDTTGAVGYAYQTYYQNSITNAQSSLSDWILPTGFSWYSLGKMRQRIMDKLVSNGYINGISVSDTMVNDWINEWLENMTNAIADVNQDYQMGTMAIGFSGTNELGTITQSDFKGGLRRVWYTDGSGTYQATKMDSNSYSPNKIFVNTYPYFYMQGDNVIGRQPHDISGSFICEYYNQASYLVEDTDQLPVTMQNHTKGFISYAHAQALFKDQKIPEATAKLQEAMADMQKFAIQMTPRNMTGQDYVQIVESTGGDDNLWLNL